MVSCEQWSPAAKKFFRARDFWDKLHWNQTATQTLDIANPLFIPPHPTPSLSYFSQKKQIMHFATSELVPTLITCSIK